MKKIVISICLLFFISSFYAQGLKFVETTHEFYHIQETAGKAACQFLFTNTSSDDIKISQINSTACPCLSLIGKNQPYNPMKKETFTYMSIRATAKACLLSPFK